MIHYLVIAGALIQLVGALVYARATWRGTARPNRVTWALWALAPLIGTAAAVVDGVGIAILPVFMAGFGPLIVFVVSLRNREAYWTLGRFDYACGAFSLAALFVWAMTHEPMTAIALAIVADGLAALPTLKKSWSAPESESVSVYAATILSAGFGMWAVGEWRPEAYAFGAYLILINIAIVAALYRSRLQRAVVRMAR